MKFTLIDLKGMFPLIQKTNNPNDEAGILTVDYLFAIILAMGFVALLFAMSLTLTVVEVVQYMTFSSARSYSVGHTTDKLAKERAEEKFAQLYSDKRILSLLTGGWFKLVDDPQVGIASQSEFPFTTALDQERYTFHGVSVTLHAKILDLKLPLYGSTNNLSEGEGFRTRIHSFLGREPHIDECENLNKIRWNWIKEQYPDQNVNNSNDYYSMSDNGC